jgi:hypothetical protein
MVGLPTIDAQIEDDIATAGQVVGVFAAMAGYD